MGRVACNKMIVLLYSNMKRRCTDSVETKIKSAYPRADLEGGKTLWAVVRCKNEFMV